MSCRPRQAPSFTNFSFSFLSDLTEFYRFWTGFYRVLPSFTGFHCFACVCGMYRHWMSFKSRAWSCFVEGFVLFAGPLLLRFFFFFLGCDADVASASTCSWRSSTTAAAGSSWWRHRTTTASRAIRSADCRSSASRTGASTQFSFSFLFFFWQTNHLKNHFLFRCYVVGLFASLHKTWRWSFCCSH